MSTFRSSKKESPLHTVYILVKNIITAINNSAHSDPWGKETGIKHF